MEGLSGVGGRVHNCGRPTSHPDQVSWHAPQEDPLNNLTRSADVVDSASHVPYLESSYLASHCNWYSAEHVLFLGGDNLTGIQCEMNKFDDMLAYLADKDESFAELIAVDEKLDLFERAWCMAEVAEAKQMGMEQNLKLRNKETLIFRQNTLRCLDVTEMQASRPEDVQAILAKIPDTKAFNDYLQDLMFDRNSALLTNWHKADALQQMEEASRVLRWARISEAVEDGAITWREWFS